MNFYFAFYKVDQSYARWDDRLINWWTGKLGYSHVEIVVDDNNEYIMYTSSPRDGGVRKKKHNWDEKIWTYIKIDLDFDHLQEIFNLTVGDKYDWLGILGFILPTKDRTHEWFCSEWCSNVLKTYGNKTLSILEPSKISPNKLYSLFKNDQ